LRIELPVKAITVTNEDLGIEEYEETMALITVEHIVYMTEQKDSTTLITMINRDDITVLLSYSDVKALLE